MTIITDAGAGYSRRTMLQGLGSLFAAPAIVRIDSLMAMPRRPLILPGDLEFYPCDGRELREEAHPSLFNAMRFLDHSRRTHADHIESLGHDPERVARHRAYVGRQYGGHPEDGTFLMPDFTAEAQDESLKRGVPVEYELDRHGAVYQVVNGTRERIG